MLKVEAPYLSAMGIWYFSWGLFKLSEYGGWWGKKGSLPTLEFHRWLAVKNVSIEMPYRVIKNE